MFDSTELTEKMGTGKKILVNRSMAELPSDLKITQLLNVFILRLAT